MLAAKGLLEALAQADEEEPMDRNTAEDYDLGDVLKAVLCVTEIVRNVEV